MVCPLAVAVSVAVVAAGSMVAGGRYTTVPPVVPEMVPGPVSAHVTELASAAGPAVNVVGPLMVCEPDGVTVSVGCGSLGAQANRTAQRLTMRRMRSPAADVAQRDPRGALIVNREFCGGP
jgi:hypothetical protein